MIRCSCHAACSHLYRKMAVLQCKEIKDIIQYKIFNLVINMYISVIGSLDQRLLKSDILIIDIFVFFNC